MFAKLYSMNILEAFLELDKINEETENATGIFLTNIEIFNKGKKLNTKAYTNYINGLIKKYGRFNASRQARKNNRTGEIHIHHIVPEALGGPDIDENKILVTYKEHLNAHAKLALENPDCYEAQQAAEVLIVNGTEADSSELLLPERKKIMKNMIRGLSLRNAGENNPNAGTTWNDKARAEQSDRMSSKSANKIKIVYEDGETEETTPKIFAKAIGLETPSNIYKWISGTKDINSNRLLNKVGVERIEYSNPEEVKHISSEKLGILGIDIKTGDIKKFSSVVDAAKFISEKNGNIKDYKSYKGGINKSYTKNIPGTNNYKSGFGYYWIKDTASEQFIRAIQTYIKNNN